MKSDKKTNCIEWDFAVERYSTEAFSHHSYFIRAGEEAAIVDPMTEPFLYLTLLDETLTKLKYVFLTHRSVDFVSGGEQLSRLTGAKVIQSTDQVDNGAKYSLGSVCLTLIKTPGFTCDSCCFLLTNSKKVNRAVFTGGLILYGDIGRPIQSLPKRPSPTAEELFNSIAAVTKLAADNSKFLFYPAYSEGAFFNPSINESTSNCLCEQMKSNCCLTMNKEAFLNEMSKSPFPQAKRYCSNIQTAQLTVNVKEFIQKITRLNVEDVEKHMKSEDVYVLDTRDQSYSSKGFIPNSIIASLKVGFSKFIPSLFTPQIKIILVTEPNMENESVLSLLRIGYQNILGCLDGGYASWEKAGKAQSKVVYIACTELPSILEKGGKVVDVRERGEFKADGVVKEAILIPLTELSDRIKEIPKAGVLYLLCKSGARATLASTYLTRYGIKSSMNVFLGGCMKLKANGYPLISYS